MPTPTFTPRLIAVINPADNPTVVDVVTFDCRYSMNTIPEGTVILAVGRKIPGYEVSNAHSVGTSSLWQVPIDIWMTSYNNLNRTWGRYLLFAGWVVGTGYKRTAEGMSITLSVKHWLSALSFASAVSESSQPNNPSQFSLATLIGDPDAGGGGFNHTTLQNNLQSDDVIADLFGRVILPWFTELASEDRMYEADADLSASGNANAYALAALARFRGNPYRGDAAMFDDVASLPLYTGGREETESMADAIVEDIGYCTVAGSRNDPESMASTNLWDKLTGYLAYTYMFSVIPRPDVALVVPFIPGLQSHFKTVYSNEIVGLDISGSRGWELRAYGVYKQVGSLAGSILPGASSDVLDDIDCGGLYIGSKRGMVLLANAPAFMSEMAAPTGNAKEAIGFGAKAANGFNFPAAGVAPVMKTPTDASEIQSFALDNLAHVQYLTEILKGRNGHITTGLRLDIAPGSTIRLEGLTSGYTENSLLPAEATAFYATVTGVTIHVSSDEGSPSCLSTFTLAHVRTALENTLDQTSVARHPFYDRVWTGDTLSDAVASGNIAPNASLSDYTVLGV